MAWSELEATDGRGHMSVYQGHGFGARLEFDCHGDPRKIEIRPTAGTVFSAALLEYLKPFAEPAVIVPGQLAIVDRARYFRLYVSPARLQVQLRKEAPLTVVGELLTQLERAQKPMPCATCPSLCQAAALEYGAADGELHIDSQRCTRCLDCVRHHLDPVCTPPFSGEFIAGGALAGP